MSSLGEHIRGGEIHESCEPRRTRNTPAAEQRIHTARVSRVLRVSWHDACNPPDWLSFAEIRDYSQCNVKPSWSGFGFSSAEQKLIKYNFNECCNLPRHTSLHTHKHSQYTTSDVRQDTFNCSCLDPLFLVGIILSYSHFQETVWEFRICYFAKLTLRYFVP